MCKHPWHITRGCYRNMTEWLCSCHSGADVNIWRANVVPSLGINTGIRKGLASSITWTSTILGVVKWCDRANAISMHHVNRMNWGWHHKGNKNDWLYDFGEKMSSHHFLPFSRSFKETVISLLNVFISDSTILKTANARNAHQPWHITVYFISIINTALCT